MIEVKNLDFHYGNKLVYKDINLTWQPGHIAALLGANGSGKTTLLRLLAGLLPPSNGTITIGGEKPFARNVSFLQHIFMVPEDFALPAVKASKLANMYGGFYPQFSKTLFVQYLDEFEVPHQSRLEQLSFGQQKKAWLSFALACNTNLLLLDEPTNGLDIASKATLRKRLLAQLNPNRCILVSTHQVRDLEWLFDWVTIIEKGGIAWHDSTENLSAYGQTESMEESYLRILQNQDKLTQL
jgi:ABC-2 type transport system ATP-binding protein